MTYLTEYGTLNVLPEQLVLIELDGEEVTCGNLFKDSLISRYEAEAIAKSTHNLAGRFSGLGVKNG